MSDLLGQEIADPAYRADANLRMYEIQLFPEEGDVNLHMVGVSL